MPNILKGKKKFKKTLLLNKKLYKFLTFNIFKTLRRLKKHVRIKSKLKILQNLLSFEYSMPYIILSSNIVKSFSDLKIFDKISLYELLYRVEFTFREFKEYNKGSLIYYSDEYKDIPVMKDLYNKFNMAAPSNLFVAELFGCS